MPLRVHQKLRKGSEPPENDADLQLEWAGRTEEEDKVLQSHLKLSNWDRGRW